MSINLHCKEVELVQTPTYITYLCYYAEFSQTEHKRNKPGHWKSILAKYLLWYRDYLLSGPQEEGDYADNLSIYEAHAAHLAKTAKKYKKLKFTIG